MSCSIVPIPFPTKQHDVDTYILCLLNHNDLLNVRKTCRYFRFLCRKKNDNFWLSYLKSKYNVENLILPIGTTWKQVYDGLTLKLTDRIFKYRSNKDPICLIRPDVRSKIRGFLRVIVNCLNEKQFDIVPIFKWVKWCGYGTYTLAEIVCSVLFHTGLTLPDEIWNSLGIYSVDKENHVIKGEPVGPPVLKLLPPIYSVKYIVLHVLLSKIIDACVPYEAGRRHIINVQNLYLSILHCGECSRIYGKYVPPLPFESILVNPIGGTSKEHSKLIIETIKNNLLNKTNEYTGYVLDKTNSVYISEEFLHNINVCIVYSSMRIYGTGFTVQLDNKTINDTVDIMKSKFKGSMPISIENNKLKIIQYVMLRGILRYAYDLNGSMPITYETLVDSVVPTNPYIGEFVEKFIYVPVRNDRKR